MLVSVLKDDALAWPLRQKWFWMLFGMLVLAVILPLLLVGVIANSLGSLFVSLIVVLVIWVVFRSYREWVAKNRSKD